MLKHYTERVYYSKDIIIIMQMIKIYKKKLKNRYLHPNYIQAPGYL